MMKKTLLTLLCVVAGWNASTTQKNEMPHLIEHHGRKELIVNGKPFLMLAGELHNSSTGSTHYMKPIWQRMAQKNLNTS